MAKETEMSITLSEMFPGFRFSPTDVELISYYLRRKMAGDESSVSVIAEVEIYKFEPCDLPDQSILKSENEWFFFCARGRKYPHGSQSRRGTELGYWKATGKERNVKSGSQVVGTKRTLVFHIGRAPRGERTEWIMHEYCMSGAPQDALVVCRLRRNGDFHSNSTQTQMQDGQCDGHCDTSNDVIDLTHASEGDKTMDSYSPSLSEQNLPNDNNAESSHDVAKNLGRRSYDVEKSSTRRLQGLVGQRSHSEWAKSVRHCNPVRLCGKRYTPTDRIMTSLSPVSWRVDRTG